MEKNQDRLEVIENIKKSIQEQKYNNKVELNDHIVTPEEQKRVICNYDNTKMKFTNKLSLIIAQSITNMITNRINKNTKIEGIENIKEINTGAIITCNHFSKFDNTVIRYFANSVGKKDNFDIIIEECNVFMKGAIGWLMRGNRTLPINANKSYLENNFNPAFKELLDRKDFILIYPEQEMWFNYKKPRNLKIGAYHYAAKFNVPIIPCFISIKETDEIDASGFKKVNYTLHVMKPIYPDSTKDIKTSKGEMRKKDYELKVQAYEMAYNKKLDYTFENNDIAGL